MSKVLQWVLVVIGFLLIWKFLLPLVGLSSTASFWLSAAFTLTVVLMIGRLWPMMRIPVPFLHKIGWVPLIIILVVILAIGGSFAKWGLPAPGAAISTGATPSGAAASTDACKASIGNDAILGKASTLYLNGYDKESNTPSSVVNLGSIGWIYRNIQDSAGYSSATTATSGTSTTGFAVGDTVYVFGGNTSYYIEPYSGCVDSESKSVNLNAHALAATTNLQTVCYDSTGAATLTAGVSSLTDYNLTLGSSDSKFIYCELTVNVANKAFVYDGIAVAKFYNISNVVPVSDDLGDTYTAAATPLSFQSQNVQLDASATAGQVINKDYVIYQIQSPKILSQWDTVKVKFKVETTSNDPRASTENTTSFNGFAVVWIDAGPARGDDGKTYLDIYSHDVAQSNKGISETLTSPLGKDNGVLIGAN
jgi:hypothetical protein